MNAVVAAPRSQPNVLLLGFEGDLKSAVSEMLDGQSGNTRFSTGFQAFDDLNRRLGLFAVWHSSRIDANIFYFNKPANLPLIIDQYAAIKGVKYAEPNSSLFVHEPPGIEACRSNGILHFIFSNPAGDLNPVLPARAEGSCFRVRSGRVERCGTESVCEGAPDVP